MNKIQLWGGIFLLANTACFAESDSKQGWFAGLSLAATSINTDINVDDRDSSLSGFGGYRFNDYIAVQGEFTTLGQYEGKEEGLNAIELGGYGVSAKGIIPFGRSGFELYGRLGLAVLHYSQKVDISGTELDHDSTGDAIISSLGFSYTPSGFQRMSFHLEYANYYFETEKTFVDDDDPESNSVSRLGVGAQYNF